MLPRDTWPMNVEKYITFDNFPFVNIQHIWYYEIVMNYGIVFVKWCMVHLLGCQTIGFMWDVRWFKQCMTIAWHTEKEYLFIKRWKHEALNKSVPMDSNPLIHRLVEEVCNVHKDWERTMFMLVAFISYNFNVNQNHSQFNSIHNLCVWRVEVPTTRAHNLIPPRSC